jgi:alkyl sulfatase BDS1-like metallo-beta-lactamase superfamily hydrolase
VLNWSFTDPNETFVLTLENCALSYVAGAQAATADASLRLVRGALDEVIAKQTGFPEASPAARSNATVIRTGLRS